MTRGKTSCWGESPSDIDMHTHVRNNLVRRLRELFLLHSQLSITILSVAQISPTQSKLPFVYGGTILLTRAGSFSYHLAVTRTSSPGHISYQIWLVLHRIMQ